MADEDVEEAVTYGGGRKGRTSRQRQQGRHYTSIRIRGVVVAAAVACVNRGDGIDGLGMIVRGV